MKYKQFDFFNVIVDTLKLQPGCHFFILKVFDEADDLCDVFSFDSKEEFDKYFDTKPHPYYPCNMYIPKNIVKEYGERTYDCIIGDETYYVNIRNSYLIVDGKLIRE
jgi:hypothetical protein